MSPLEEGSAHRRNLYVYNTKHSQQIDIHAPGGIRSRNPRKRTTAELPLDRTATGIGIKRFILYIYLYLSHLYLCLRSIYKNADILP
jgi:hypothetical protein